mmetsp:Transcript_27706/g.76275  ORF Transcript_27706/g.76275 Transcript_27706/m.76275 type:complete len:243 (+) Transcript_27706:1238-1966(+)
MAFATPPLWSSSLYTDSACLALSRASLVRPLDISALAIVTSASPWPFLSSISLHTISDSRAEASAASTPSSPKSCVMATVCNAEPVNFLSPSSLNRPRACLDKRTASFMSPSLAEAVAMACVALAWPFLSPFSWKYTAFSVATDFAALLGPSLAASTSLSVISAAISPSVSPSSRNVARASLASCAAAASSFTCMRAFAHVVFADATICLSLTSVKSSSARVAVARASLASPCARSAAARVS